MGDAPIVYAPFGGERFYVLILFNHSYKPIGPVVIENLFFRQSFPVCVFLAQSVHIGIADGVVLHLVGVRRQIVVRWIVGKTWCAIHASTPKCLRMVLSILR